MPLKLFIGIIIITVISVIIVTSVIWVILICVCKGRRNRAPPKRPDEQSPVANHEFDGSIPTTSDPFTVPPLLATDGSGLVFGYGHLYPDNQRHITEKDILAHIRGESNGSESIPLISARNAQLSGGIEALPAVSCKNLHVEPIGEEEPLYRPQTAPQRLDSQSFYDRIKGPDPSCHSSSIDDVLSEGRVPASPRKDALYCSCPADISDTNLLKCVTDTPQKRSNVSGRTSHKKRVPRRPSHALLRRDIDNEKYYDHASSSGVESGESSSSSDSVSVTNFEVARAKSSSVLGAV